MSETMMRLTFDPILSVHSVGTSSTEKPACFNENSRFTSKARSAMRNDDRFFRRRFGASLCTTLSVFNVHPEERFNDEMKAPAGKTAQRVCAWCSTEPGSQRDPITQSTRSVSFTNSWKALGAMPPSGVHVADQVGGRR